MTKKTTTPETPATPKSRRKPRGKTGTTAKPTRASKQQARVEPDSAPAPSDVGIPKPVKVRKASGLDAAVQVLKDANEPMRCKDIVQTMLDKGMWSTGGATPTATIYAAILREIKTKGSKARFKKTDRGMFSFNA